MFEKHKMQSLDLMDNNLMIRLFLGFHEFVYLLFHIIFLKVNLFIKIHRGDF